MQRGFLFGLNFKDVPSASNWTVWSVENYDAVVLPKTCEELEQIPLDRPHNFLVLLDKNSIDKEIVRLGVEAHMFWELQKVRDALNDLCKKWFVNDCKASSKDTIDISEDSPTSITFDKTPASSSIVIVGSQKEKEQCIKFGFVEKLIELWSLRRCIDQQNFDL